MKFLKSVKGHTLIEIMLVLALGMSLALIGLKFYKQLDDQLQLNRLQYNIDTLFQAMRLYHIVNCRGTYDASQNLTTIGKLNPASGVTITTPFPISNIATGLGPVSTGGPGYLPRWPLPTNPIVGTDPAHNPTYPAYTVQFNPITVSQISYNACTAWAYSGNPVDSLTCTATEQIISTSVPPSPPVTQAAVLVWLSQVAVQIYNPGLSTAAYKVLVQQYKNELNADCISFWNGISVAQCKTNPAQPATNAYLVWQRFPSYVGSGGATTFLQSMPLLKQFNLQYEHDQMYEFNQGYSGANAPQYYMCGG